MKLDILHVILLFGIFFLLLNFYNESLLWDEAVFLSNAKVLIGENNYIENFRPPLLPLLIGLAWNLTGKSILIAKLIVITFSVLSIYVFYKVCQFYFKKPLYPAILFAFSPLIIYWSFRAYSDILNMFLILLSFYFFKKKNYVISGVSTALAFLARFTASIFGFSIFISLLIERRFKNIGKYFIGLLILIPWLIYNFMTYGNPIYDFFMDYTLARTWTQPYTQPLINHLINLIEIFNFLLPFLFIGCVKFFKKTKEPVILFYIIFSIIFLLSTNLKSSRYFIMILPFLYIFIYRGIEWFKYKEITFLLVVISVVISLIGTIILNTAEKICWPSTKEAVDYISRYVEKNETVISNFWPYFGFFTNSTVYSNYADINLLIEQYHPKFLIFRYEEWMPAPENLNIKKEKVIKSVCGEILIYRI